jgi:S-layer homology domain
MRIGKRRISKKLAVILVAVVLVLGVGGAGAAYAAGVLPFTDISGHWAQQAIVNVAARGIMTGHADGTFGPDQTVTRAQLATTVDRLHTEALTAIPANRGCPDCHAGQFTLKNEAVNNGGAAVHSALPDSADVITCLTCHAPGSGAQAGKGVAAPISLRDIVHPVHMGSKIFTTEFVGNCFSCHNISGNGTYQILSQAVDTNAKGVPNTLPIPGAINPIEAH